MHHEDKAQTHRAEQDRPNRESNMEPAEGSRGNTNVGGETAGNQGGRGTATMHHAERGSSDLPSAAFGEGDEDADDAGGISNRPLGEEQDRQDNLPPRGERRDENWKED
jgi:hypothetical protein